MARQYVKCPKCGNLTQADFPYCNYCGAELENLELDIEEIVEKQTSTPEPPIEPLEPQSTPYMDISASNKISSPETDAIAVKSIKGNFLQIYKKYPKRILTIFAALIITIIAAIVLPLAMCGTKPSKEERIYELVLEASYKFKNPSSVRIVSGKVNYDTTDTENPPYEFRDFEIEKGYYINANLRLSATNGFGATTTDYYHIIYDKEGKLSVENINDSMKDTMDLIDEYPSMKPDLLFVLQTLVDWYDECELRDSFDIDRVNSLLDKKWNK